ncbi:hypothetical protein GGR51DRAFT_564465 [Nemania sp. FL0031]|nr:hypothetical protein GGR51DRAFT_564465 [Nemania sp. FL0031]
MILEWLWPHLLLCLLYLGVVYCFMWVESVFPQLWFIKYLCVFQLGYQAGRRKEEQPTQEPNQNQCRQRSSPPYSSSQPPPRLYQPPSTLRQPPPEIYQPQFELYQPRHEIYQLLPELDQSQPRLYQVPQENDEQYQQ